MGTSFPNSSRKEFSILRCSICDKPVAIESAKTDGDGNAVHDGCYESKLKLEPATLDGQEHTTCPWKVVAEEVSREQDPKKMTSLITELNQALDEQKLDGTPKPSPDDKPKPDGK